MLILGTVFQCLGPLTSVAALLSSKPLFNSPLEKREEANACVNAVYNLGYAIYIFL